MTRIRYSVMALACKLLIEKYNILYVECIEIINKKKETYGDLSNLPYKGMYTNLLGTTEKIDNLIHMVENNSGLESWKQGDLTAIIFKTGEKMVCMFYCSDKYGLEDFEYSKEIFEEYNRLVME